MYNKMGDGQPMAFNPEADVLALACCDCGLVHDIKITVNPDGTATIAHYRNKRATAQLRRHDYGYLQKRPGRYRMVRDDQ